ncbi:MAG TPA: MATE family efflux transporter [Pyrinomonadaceae bacterium]|nr:MATE family efflux transporter [Pyrinomonadaceae bacterium]
MSFNSETPSAEAVDNSFWAVLREAVRGSNRDFTTGPIGLGIFLLAVPMILEMSMESLFAVVDIFFVAKLGADAVAIVGLTESVMALIYAVAFGFAISATATVARRTGEKDAAGAAKSAAHVIYCGVIVSLVISAIGIIFAPQILTLLGAKPHILAEGSQFMRIMVGGNAAVLFIFLLNAIFRGAGDAAIAMRVLILANGLNMILSPCFIFGVSFFPELGVTGAAVGTTIGRSIGVLYAAWHLFRAGGRIHISRDSWRFDPTLLWKLIKLSSTGVFQLLVATASWTALMPIMAGFGEVAIAGYIIALRVVMFALLPALGLSNAAATMVGQNLGAGKPERAEAAVWKAAWFNAAFYSAIGLIFLIFSHPIISIFTQEPEVLRYGTSALHIIAYGFAFYGLGMVLETAFNGAGDTWTPTYLNLLVFWIFEIPLAYALAYRFNLGPDGVFWAITLAFSLLAIASGLLFRRGKWKQKTV